LLGHLSEMCEGSGVSATVVFDRVPVIPSVAGYLAQGCIPGGTHRNWASYGSKIGPLTDEQRYILADPQTSGGLLIAVTEEAAPAVELLLPEGYRHALGRLEPFTKGPLIRVV